MYPQHVSHLFRRWIARTNRHPVPTRRPANLKLETFEDRVVPATLPAPFVTDTSVVSGTSNIINPNIPGYFNPQAVYDPLDANRIVLVSTNGLAVQAQISTDGGQSFTPFFTNMGGNRVRDPGLSGGGGFSHSSSPSVTYSRDGFIYLVASEHTGDKSRGVIVVHKFDARAELPIELDINTTPRSPLYGPTLGNVVYQWDGDDDPAFNPTIAINNNLPQYTDPITGITRTDTMVGKAVYVAYNIDAQAQTASGSSSTVFLSASSDGGLNFSNPLPAIAGNSVAPDLAFTPDGKLVVTATSKGTTASGGTVTIDVSQPDFGDAGFTPVTVFESPLFRGGFIIDASGTPAVPATTVFPPNTGVPPGMPQYETVFLPPDFGQITDLDVRMSILHTNLNELNATLELVITNDDLTTTTRRIRLFDDINSGGQRLGIYIDPDFTNLRSVGTVFSDQAGRTIDSTLNDVPYIGQYRVSGGTFGAGYVQSLASLIGGLSQSQIARGLQFRLVLVDTAADQIDVNPPFFSRLVDWNVKFSGQIDAGGFGFDEFVGVATTSGKDTIHPNTPAISPTFGIGASPSVAIDQHLGSLSPYAGRQYVAYTTGTGSNTNVVVASRNPGDLFFTPVQVNDDTVFDSFTGGNRAQFMPSITVDPVTGTVVVMWYDARFDANNTRATTYVATSIDGGLTWSTQEYTDSLTYRPYLNAPKTAVDTITGRTIFLEPTPTNFPALENAAGNFQSILAYGGRLNPFWTGNTGGSGTSIFTATASIGAGPRIVSSDMGAITRDGVTVDNRVSVVGQAVVTQTGFVYNNTFVVGGPADGTRRLDGFVIEFDRPIHVPSLDPADFKVVYLSPTDDRTRLDNPATATFDPDPASLIAVSEIIALNPGGGPNEGTRFFVKFAAPQFKVGTYSYAVGPGVHDRIARPGSAPYVEADPLSVSNTTPTTIVAGTTVSVIPVSGFTDTRSVVGNVAVTVDVGHANPNDLTLTLVAPNGVRVTLFQGSGDGEFQGNFSGTTFTDYAQTPGFLGTPTFSIDLKAVGTGTNTARVRLASPVVPGTLTSADIRRLVRADGTFVVGPFTVIEGPPLASGLVSELTISAGGGLQFNESYVVEYNRIDVLTRLQDKNRAVGLNAPSVSPNGFYLPVDSLSALFGTIPADDWTLEITDNGTSGPGTLYGWNLTFEAVQRTEAAGSQTFVPIPETGVATSTITAPAFSNPNAVIGNTVVTVNIAHTSPVDLRISLIGPNGEQVVLSNQNFLLSTGQLFNDRVVGKPITQALTFEVSPEELLSLFNGTKPEGDWTLVVEDLLGVDSGLIVGWSIAFEPVTLVNAGEDEGTQNETGITPVGMVETSTLMLPASQTTFKSGPETIPNPGTRLSTLTVPDLPAGLVIEDVSVNFTIVHPNVSELLVVVIDPLGTERVLVSNGQASGSGFFNTTFSSQSTTSLTTSFAPYTGTFAPVQSFAAYDGRFTGGTWTLKIIDVSGNANAGTLANWSITFPLAVPEEQTPVAPATTPRNVRTYDLNVAPLLPGQVIQDVNVNVEISHQNVGDLRLTLVHPDGTEIVLSNRRGGTGDDYADTTFDDQATTPIGAGTAPFAGAFIPEQLLAVLNGKLAQGTWRLRVEDLSQNGIRGLLNRFRVDIQPGVLQPAGNPMDQDADGTAGELFDDIFATPRSVLSTGQNPGEAANGRPFTLPYDRDTLPLIVPGPFVDTSVKVVSVQGNPAAGRVSIMLDRVVLPFSFTGSDITFVNGPNGGFFDGFTVFAVDAGGTPTTGPTQYFQIAHAPTDFFDTTTLAIDGAFGYEVGLGDGIVIYDPVVNAATNFKDVTFDRVLNPTTFTAADVLRMVGPNGDIVGPFTVTPVYAGTPMPGGTAPTRVFRIAFPAQILNGQYSILFGSDIATPDQGGGVTFQIDTNQNAGISKLFGGTGTATNTNTYSSTGPATPIPAGGVATRTITITDQFTINQLIAATQANSKLIQVSLSATTPDVTKLSARLVAPAGVLDSEGNRLAIQLFTNVGTSGSTRANFTTTQFDDQAATPIQSGTAPFTGRFNPQQPLSGLNGVSFVGDWTLEITNTGAQTGSITAFGLTLPYAIPVTGVGEPIADRFSTAFRIFVQDPTNPLTRAVWTPVGPAPQTGLALENGGLPDVDAGESNYAANAGKVTAIAVDPSDPSGNTVYIGAGTGGVWKTTNFLTLDPAGPVWVPLTDFGPTQSLTVTKIALIPRNNDANQTIVFALTGGLNVNTPTGANATGVGILRSVDAGRTWQVLDSMNNGTGVPGEVAPITATSRNRLFVGTVGYDIIVDPTPAPNGQYYVYMAAQGSAAQSGVWRSADTGLTWTRMQDGPATDLQLSAGSGGANTGNLQILYAAFTGQGVRSTTQATNALSMDVLAGGFGNALIRYSGSTPVPVSQPDGNNPLAGKGRIAIAAPTLSNSPLANSYYQGWLYAAVTTPSGNFEGLYLTKDFGRNWTQVDLRGTSGTIGTYYGSNNETLVQPDFASALGAGGFGDTALTLEIDPNDPNIVYFGSSRVIRVDLTTVNTPQTFVHGDFSKAGGSTTGAFTGLGQLNNPNDVLNPYDTDFLNLQRDPLNPFVTNSTLTVTYPESPNAPPPFANNGENARWMPFDEINAGSGETYQIFTFVDPTTGRTRLITANANGVFSGVDGAFSRIGNGEELFTNVGFTSTGDLNKNGNLQIAQFYAGAVQPSQLAADVAGALFYGMSLDNGFPVSTPDVLTTGNVQGTTGDLKSSGRGTGVATDQTGSGTAYQFRLPIALDDLDSLPTDFFRVLPPNLPHNGDGFSRTTGLVRDGIDNPGLSVGQWPALDTGIGYFAVNPVDGSGLLISSEDGRIYRSIDQGRNWVVVGEPGAPSSVSGSYARAVAFGAPAAGSGELNNFLYVGTEAGEVFVTQTGGTPWRNASAGLAGSGVIMQIVPNPQRDSVDAYLVAANGVYYNANVFATNSAWVNITGNLFTIQRNLFGTTETQLALAPGGLMTLAADFRFAIPAAGGGVAPVLYAGGVGGVFRSLDRGASWQLFPAGQTFVDSATGASLSIPNGGYLPNAIVTDLDLSVGNVDPTTGLPQQAGGLNMLVATTYGRGQFAIRLDTTLPNNVVFQSGPKVVSIASDDNADTSATTNINPDRIRVTFDSPVDPTTFTPADVVLTGPNGPITVTSVVKVSVPDANGADPRNVYEIRFAPQTAPGTYTVEFGPEIASPGGEKMNQNGNMVNGENNATASDKFAASLLFNRPVQGSLQVTGMPANATAGQTVTLTVRAFDNNNPAQPLNTNTTVQFASSDNGVMTVIPGPVQLTNGVATVQVVLTRTGFQTVTVSTADNTLNPSTVSTTVVPGDVASLTVGVSPTGVSAGGTVQATVTAFDRFGNPATNYNGSVTLTSSDPQAQLPPAFTLTNGTATQPVVLRTSGQQTITANTVNLAGTPVSRTSDPITVTSGAATRLTVFNPPSTVTAGAPVEVLVAATDAFGNVARTFGGLIVVTSTDGKAVLETPAGLGADGPAGEVRITLDLRTVGTQFVAFTLQGSTDPQFTRTISTNVVAGPAVRFGVTANPTAVNAGGQTSVTVTAFDASGNVATGYAGQVQLSVPGDPQATVPGPFALGGDGVEQVLVTLRTAGGQTIQAVDTANGNANGSATVTVTPGSLARYSVTGPLSVVTGTPSTYTIRATDAFGNAVSTFNGTARVSVSDPDSTAPTSVSIVNGVGTFSATLRTFGNQTIDVTDVQFSTVTGTITTAVTPVPVVPPPTGPGTPVPPGTPFPPPGPPLGVNPASLPPLFSVALGAGVVNRVQVYSQAGQPISRFTAYEQGFSGGVRTAMARTPTGVHVITVPGPGRQTDVRVFEPITSDLPTMSFLPFEVSFTGGSFVSTADIDRDGYDDYAISPDEGGGPRVKIISGRTGQTLVDFFGIDDPNFRGGARTAMGDINGDGTPDLIVAAGFGGGPRVAVWDGASLVAGQFQRLTPDFFAYEPALRNGVYVAAGDLDGDGKAEIITGAGPGGGPRILAFSGDGLLNGQQVQLMDFFAGNVDNRGGIRVAAVNLDNDDLVDLVVGDGEAAGSRVTGYLGSTIRASNPPAAVFAFDDLPGYTGGVFVG